MRILSVFILLMLSLLTGCVVTNDRPVSIEIRQLKLLRVSPFEQRFKLTMTINNNNKTKQFIRKFNYRLILGDVQVTTGEEFIWKDIPAFSEQEIDIFFSTNIWGQLSTVFATAKEHRQLNYSLTGEVRTGILIFQQVSYVKYANILTPDQLPMNRLEKLQKLMPSLKP